MIPGTLLTWVVLMFVAAPFDLGVSTQLADPHAWWGLWVARYGEWPGWALLLASLALVRRRDDWGRAARATVWLTLLHPVLITQSLKLLWGRVRFRDLGHFTPFYVPAGVGTGTSFPSGHVAMATVVLPLALLLARRRQRLAALALAAWPLAVSFGRVQAGAHYLTDCLFSLGLGVVLTLVLDRTRPGSG